jgi:hypothetical protein
VSSGDARSRILLDRIERSKRADRSARVDDWRGQPAEKHAAALVAAIELAEAVERSKHEPSPRTPPPPPLLPRAASRRSA